jgi:serine protease Do
VIAAALIVGLQIADAHWAVVLPCPKVLAPGANQGTGVVVGVKDGFAYVLTANHVAAADRVEVQFATRENYPKGAWFGDGASVVARWPDPDIALVRFPLAGRVPEVLPLAPAWQRPKTFPARVLTVGVGSRPASTAVPDTLRAKEFVRRQGKQPAFFWRTAVAPEPGRSGGPLLDERRRVIGIAVAVRGGAGYYAHHDEIVAALKRGGYEWLVPAAE